MIYITIFYLFVCSKAVLKQRCWKFFLLRNSENYAFILSVNRQKEEPCITLFQIAPCRNHVRPIKDEPTSFRSVSILIPSVCMFPTDFMLAGKKRHYTSVNEAKCCLKKLPASWQNSFAPEEKKKIWLNNIVLLTSLLQCRIIILTTYVDIIIYFHLKKARLISALPYLAIRNRHLAALIAPLIKSHQEKLCRIFLFFFELFSLSSVCVCVCVTFFQI